MFIFAYLPSTSSVFSTAPITQADTNSELGPIGNGLMTDVHIRIPTLNKLCRV